MAVVTFDPAAFKAAYPEFAAVPDARLSYFFSIATLYLSNADNSPVQNVTRRGLYLFMITAHIAYLSGALSADGTPPAVGRVSSASEGSVSIDTDFPLTPNTAWWMMSQYGAQFWQATASLRTMHYRARPTCPR